MRWKIFGSKYFQIVLAHVSGKESQWGSKKKKLGIQRNKKIGICLFCGYCAAVTVSGLLSCYNA
jgi:hypothetical protein